MNNLIIAKNYETFGEEGLTSNKVIYYKEDNMVKFRANITDNPYGESEVVTVGGSDSNSLEKVFAGKSDTWNVPNDITTIPTYVLYSNNEIKHIITTDKTTAIDGYAFYSCSNLLSFNSNNDGTLDLRTVDNIGASTFRLCLKITEILLSQNITIIRASAFRGCKPTYVDIHNSVVVIEDYAFYTTTTSLVVNFGNTRNTIPTVENNSFYYKTKFVVPDALYDEWKTTSNWSNYADIVKYSEYNN